jgi:N6-adenosine-specific RNA methylase IME4
MKILEIEQEEKIFKTNIPAGKYQVFIANLTVPFNSDLTQLPIADLGEQDSVVFLWVSNQGLTEGIKIMHSWGYKYHHCMIRNNDFMEDITANADILIIGIKGNHPDLIQNTNSFEKIAMPRRIVELISATYAGSKLEILPDGWSIWGNEV